MSPQRLRLPSNPIKVRKADRRNAEVLLAEVDQSNTELAARRDQRLVAGMNAATAAVTRAVRRFDSDDARPAPKRGPEADDDAVFALLDDLEHLAALTQDYLNKKYPATRRRLASMKVPVRRRIAASEMECCSGSWAQGMSELMAGVDSTLYESLHRFRHRLYEADKKLANRRHTFSAAAQGAHRILGRGRESAHGGVLDAATEVLLGLLVAGQPRRRRTVSVLGDEERALWAMFPATADLPAIWGRLEKWFLPRFRETDFGIVGEQLRLESAAAAREAVPLWNDIPDDERKILETMLNLAEGAKRTHANIAREAKLLKPSQKAPGRISKLFGRLRRLKLTRKLEGEKGETINQLPRGLPDALRLSAAARGLAVPQ